MNHAKNAASSNSDSNSERKRIRSECEHDNAYQGDSDTQDGQLEIDAPLKIMQSILTLPKGVRLKRLSPKKRKGNKQLCLNCNYCRKYSPGNSACCFYQPPQVSTRATF